MGGRVVSQLNAKQLKKIALSLAPVIVFVLLGFLLAGAGEGASEAEVDAASDASWFVFVCGLIGIIGSVALMALKPGPLGDEVADSGGGTQNLDAVLSALGRGNIEEALSLARDATTVTPSIENGIRGLGASGGGGEVKQAATDLRGFFEEMGYSLSNLSELLTNQSAALGELNSNEESNRQFFQTVSESVEHLGQRSEDSASSIIEMVTINNEVRENIHNLSLSLQETTSAIEEMTFSSKEVANNIEELSTAAEDTAAAMNQMDMAINQVETNANETSKLSETVTSDAEIGVNAIKQTIQGIDRIKESSRVAADVIGNLGQKINEIGIILNVIDDVAEQTNLLALNAAIIAAQAGEHGRGFAVVADEIKALAERTGGAIREIADLIKSIQQESRNAISVMSRGVEDVEDGVRLGHNAEDALRNIVDSAKRSTLMIQNIAQATVEQARGSKQTNNAISRIAEQVQQIALATQEQAKGADHIMSMAERIKAITQHVERSADEQKRGGLAVTQSIEAIRELVEGLQTGHGTQVSGFDQAGQAAVNMAEVGGQLLGVSQSLSRLVADASGTVDRLSPRE